MWDYGLSYYLWGECIGTISDLIELWSTKDTNMTVRPSTQTELLTVTCVNSKRRTNLMKIYEFQF